jgi:hypothetical protein
MRRAWIVVFILSVLAGTAAGSLAPKTWGYASPWGVCVGVALYFVAFRRPVLGERFAGGARGTRGAPEARWLGPRGVLASALLRASAFLALVLLILYVAYDLLRSSDLRWPLATLAAWSVVDATLERGSATERGDVDR